MALTESIEYDKIEVVGTVQTCTGPEEAHSHQER